MLKKLMEFFSLDFSYRTEKGVKLNVRHTDNGFPRASIDFSDSQTKEVVRKEMEKWAQYEIVDGRLVKKDE